MMEMMEKLGLSSKRFTIIFVVCFIVLPILFMTYQNSGFEAFQIFAKGKILGGKAQNFTVNDLGKEAHNTVEVGKGALNVTDKDLGEEAQNITAEVVKGGLNVTDKDLGEAQNNTAEVGKGALNVTDKDLGEEAQNITAEVVKGGLNVTDEDLGEAQNNTAEVGKGAANVTDEDLGETAKNISAEVVKGALNVTDKELGEEAQNITAKAASRVKEQNVTKRGKGYQNTREVGVGSRNGSSKSPRRESNKLLDGLLSPGFNEESCISRYQSYLYRKISANKPSAYLISKLRRYEDLHKQCGPQSKSYKRTIKSLIKSRLLHEVTKCKYLAWTAANGLGNRMLSMAAAFLYAVLSDRVLLVHFSSEMHGLFCEPFPSSSWLLPRDFPHKNQMGLLQTYESLLKNSVSNTSGEFTPSFVFLNLQHGQNDHEKLFHCDHSQALLRKVPAVILRTDQYFVPSLFMTPSFNEELSKMFPEKETVLHHLGRYLFHPSNEVWGLISRFYQVYLAKADERIGLQLRVFSPGSTSFQSVMDQILACTSRYKLLPEVDMQKSVTSPSKNRTLKAVMVESLFSNYSESLRTEYWTHPTVSGEIVGVYQPSHEEHQNSYDDIQNMKAWAEIYLLGLCDVLVTSSQSTFGYVAQSLGGLKPWILHKQQSKKVPNPPCVPDLSMEPCFHFPPKHDCNAKTNHNDVRSLFPYMRPCEDLSGGVKLVNEHQQL